MSAFDEDVIAREKMEQGWARAEIWGGADTSFISDLGRALIEKPGAQLPGQLNAGRNLSAMLVFFDADTFESEKELIEKMKSGLGWCADHVEIVAGLTSPERGGHKIVESLGKAMLWWSDPHSENMHSYNPLFPGGFEGWRAEIAKYGEIFASNPTTEALRWLQEYAVHLWD